MDVEVINYDDMPDGSAVVTLDLPREIVATLIQQGFNKIIKDYIDEIDQTDSDSCTCDAKCGEDD